jgi:hypothetical protein
MANPDILVCEKGHQVTAGAGAVNFCRICGAPLLRKCPEGHLSKADGRFCRVCGRPMGITVSEIEPPVEPQPVASAPIGTETSTKLSQRAEDHGTTTPDLVAAPAPSESAPTLPVAHSSGEDAHRRAAPWLVVAIAVVAVLGLAGGLVYALAPGHTSPKQTKAALSGTTQSVRSTTSTTTTPTTTTPTTAVPSENQAAQALSALLATSVTDRSSINAASNDVAACGPNLTQDQQTFDNAATSRQSLISQLSTLQGVSTLSVAMVQSLSSAWQASEQVDQDYASWASDESSGCTPNDTSNQYHQEALTPNQQATQAKMAFAAAWDPIATTYNLPTYQWNQL